ncbi:MAG: ARC6/PARC6 family protein, partial [Pseudanabaena sp.]
ELPNTGALSSDWTSPVGVDHLSWSTPTPVVDSLARGDLDTSTSHEPRLSTYSPKTPKRFQRSSTPALPPPNHRNTNNAKGRGNAVRDLGRSPRLSNVPSVRSNRNIHDAAKDSSSHSSGHLGSKRKFNVGRLVAVIVVVIALLVGSIWLVVWALRALTGTSRSEASIPLEKNLAPIVQVIKENNSIAIAQPGPLDKESATKVIETWQLTKTKALGKTYEDNLLEEILTDPALSDWKGRAKDLKASNSYLQYDVKSSDVDKVTPDGDNKAKVVAKISESRNYFSNGELDRSASKENANYTVEYDLVKKDNKWLIRDMLVF